MRFERWLRTIPLRIHSLFRRQRLESELDQELQFHLERKTEALVASGFAPDEARRTALRGMDGIERSKEECRDARRVRFLEDFAEDIRFSLRMLRKTPAFTATAILTLALGIGANSAIFSVINGVLLRSLPYPDSQQLLTLHSNQSLPDLEDIQLHTHSFDAIGGITVQALDYTSEAEPVQIYAGLCNSDLFSALGVKPALGRTFSAAEDVYGGPGLVVLAHGFWTRHFGADPGVLGKSIELSGNVYTVVGVMPRTFWKPGRAVDALASLRVVNPDAAKFRGVHFLSTYFRLKQGISSAEAAADMETADRWLALHYPEENEGRHSVLLSLQQAVVGNVRSQLLVLFGAVGFVLVIACVNFANLLLARSATRQRELAIRAALGARSGRLIRQMLTESVSLSLLGGATGLLFAWWSLHVLIALKPADVPRLADVSMDASVLVFTFAVSLLTGALFGLFPAFNAAFLAPHAKLKEDARTTSGAASGVRLRGILVVSQIALAFVLLIGAGLMIRSFEQLQQVDPGFHPESLLTMRVELPEARYREPFQQRQFRQQLLDGLNALPGVGAAMISELPMSGEFVTHNFVIDGRPPITPGEEPEAHTRTVAGDYFRIMGIPLLDGRDFGSRDHFGTQHVAIVNRTFVNQYFRGQNPVGTHIDWSRSNPRDWMTIVGVVGDVKHFGPNEPEQPALYDLYSQTSEQWKRWMFLAIRSNFSPETLLDQVKARLRGIDKQIPVTQVFTMNEVVSATLDTQRFNLILLAFFAGLAFVLAVVGIYGVVSYAIAQRTNEIGIRIALGAQPRDILWLVLAQGGRLALAGCAIGVLVALALTRFMTHLLFGVSPRDPQTFVIIVLVLDAVALLACYIPARRATQVDPIIALRYD
jgi:predicted permease